MRSWKSGERIEQRVDAGCRHRQSPADVKVALALVTRYPATNSKGAKKGSGDAACRPGKFSWLSAPTGLRAVKKRAADRRRPPSYQGERLLRLSVQVDREQTCLSALFQTPALRGVATPFSNISVDTRSPPSCCCRWTQHATEIERVNGGLGERPRAPASVAAASRRGCNCPGSRLGVCCGGSQALGKEET